MDATRLPDRGRPPPRVRRDVRGGRDPSTDYRVRTEANVRDSQGTLWLGSTDSPGYKTTHNACRGIGRPMLAVRPGREVRPSDVAAWIGEQRIGTLNVAGHRASKAPGIGERVERVMGEVFRRLADVEG